MVVDVDITNINANIYSWNNSERFEAQNHTGFVVRDVNAYVDTANAIYYRVQPGEIRVLHKTPEQNRIAVVFARSFMPHGF